LRKTIHYEHKNKIRKYYKELQKNLEDSRDIRGKKHELAFVLLGFMLAIVRSYSTLSMSFIHRQMNRMHDQLTKDLKTESTKCISLTQLRRVIEGLDIENFNTINQKYFQKLINQEFTCWKSIDGKELRGSIDGVKGEKRGENIVLMKDHASSNSKVLGFYSGKKESEKTVVKDYFSFQKRLDHLGFTLDALHATPSLLELINSQNGSYITQVKSNQFYLQEEIQLLYKHFPCESFFEKVEKGHGRIEKRKASIYQVEMNTLDERWTNTNAKYFICVEREREESKTGRKSHEISYYISNIYQTAEHFFQTIRNLLDSGSWK